MLMTETLRFLNTSSSSQFMYLEIPFVFGLRKRRVRTGLCSVLKILNQQKTEIKTAKRLHNGLWLVLVRLNSLGPVQFRFFDGLRIGLLNTNWARLGLGVSILIIGWCQG